MKISKIHARVLRSKQRGFINPHLLLLSGSGYQIQRSLRFRATALAYLTYTPANATANNTKAAFSFRVKRGALGTVQNIVAVGTTTADYHSLYFDASDRLVLLQAISSVATYGFTLNRVFRDPAAHYKITVVIDSAQAVAADRIKVWVNGEQETSGSFTYPALNTNIYFFNTGGGSLLSIGRYPTSGNYLDGYLSEFYGIQGQTGITASDFGRVDPTTGQLGDKKYSGAYGVNGFYLDFKDPTSLATLTADKSGNGNNWTANNISLTAGATYDSMIDVPLGAGGGERGNYCTLNPLMEGVSSVGTISNANLTDTFGIGSVQGTQISTFALGAGQYYYEANVSSINIGDATNNAICFGFRSVVAPNTRVEYGVITDGAIMRHCLVYTLAGVLQTRINIDTVIPTGSDTLAVAFDISAGIITSYKNGVQTAQITGVSTLIADWSPHLRRDGGNNGATWNLNFGQRPFAYTPPTGFKTMHTGNLPVPVIRKGSTDFSIALDTGANIKATSEALFPSSGLVTWIKDRANVNNHQIANSIVGLSSVLYSNLLSGEGAYSAPAGNSVGWAWRVAASDSANNSGSIASTVRANPSAGFSVVTYTGTGATGTIGHGLGIAPRMIIAKRRNGAEPFVVMHLDANVLNGQNGILNLSNNSSFVSDGSAWNSTVPGASTFTVGSSVNTNTNGAPHLAYCFAEVTGYSRIGRYIGNGSADGTFVFCGFRPRFIMYKRVDSVGNWQIADTARTLFNPSQAELLPNLNAGEGVSADASLDILSNGFKLRTANADRNANGAAYVFLALAEAPFKYANAR